MTVAHALRPALTVNRQLNGLVDLESRATSPARASGVAVPSACPDF
jgi:hypothetical protein